MPNHLPRHGAAVRALRESFATGTAFWRKEIAKVLADPDIKPEARDRKAETFRATITAEAKAALARARAEVDNAAKVRAMFDPALLRRKAVLADPARAAALRDVFAALAPAELEAFATEAVAAQDAVASFALLASITAHPNAAGDPTLAAVATRLQAPLDAGSASARADHVIAQKELALLEHADVGMARGERLDMAGLAQRFDAIELSYDDHATEYRSIGLSQAAPQAVSSQPAMVAAAAPDPLAAFGAAA